LLTDCIWLIGTLCPPTVTVGGLALNVHRADRALDLRGDGNGLAVRTRGVDRERVAAIGQLMLLLPVPFHVKFCAPALSAIVPV